MLGYVCSNNLYHTVVCKFNADFCFRILVLRYRYDKGLFKFAGVHHGTLHQFWDNDSAYIMYTGLALYSVKN